MRTCAEFSTCGCSQAGITDAALVHLRGSIVELDIRSCTQASITGATFSHLRGISYLFIGADRADLRAIAARLSLPLDDLD